MMSRSRQKRWRKRGRPRVTVCVAAICEKRRIVGASDRMITAGDVQFEPPQPKIWQLSNSIVAMYAGDTAALTEILNAVAIDVSEAIRKNPDDWVQVSWVAELYRKYYAQVALRNVEQSVLLPLGLTAKSFIANQKTMDSALVKDVALKQAEAYEELEPQSVILTGVDYEGAQLSDPDAPLVSHAHIYVGHNGETRCEDRVGFAAIGIGAAHAESEFMYAGHAPTALFRDTLLLSYFAKKQSEVSPGVGKETDMFSVGPSPGTFFRIGDHVLESLGGFRKEYDEGVKKAGNEAREKMKRFDEELSKQSRVARTQAEAPSSPSGVQ